MKLAISAFVIFAAAGAHAEGWLPENPYYSPRADKYEKIKPDLDVIRVFKGHNGKEECVTAIRYMGFENGSVYKITAKVKGPVTSRDSSDFYLHLGSALKNDFEALNSQIPASTFISDWVLIGSGDSKADTGSFDNYIGTKRIRLKFTPSLLSPSSVHFASTDSVAYVLGGTSRFACEDLKEIPFPEANPYLKMRF